MMPATLLIPQQNPSSHRKPSFRAGHGGGGHLDPEDEQFTVDPAVTPARVLPRQAQPQGPCWRLGAKGGIEGLRLLPSLAVSGLPASGNQAQHVECQPALAVPEL